MNWIKSWLATISILLDRKLMNSIKKAEEEFRRGETIPWYPTIEEVLHD